MVLNPPIKSRMFRHKSARETKSRALGQHSDGVDPWNKHEKIGFSLSAMLAAKGFSLSAMLAAKGASSSNGTGPSSATATSVGCHSQFHSRHRAATLWAATCRCQSIESDIGANLTTVANVISKDPISINVRIQLTMTAFQNVDIVSGNKKLIIAFLWQLMRFSMLHLLKNLRTHGQGKEITDADILHWENMKVKQSGKTQMDSFKVISNHL
ncbi:hypothetical protein SSX86_011020 [Deinandra increscens subsp. villosa]|uniref:Uncharacterized protein n=1 Tax=Deinandra increscens subsp. villosa TaxID=3103831 RepID=A0AAP0H0U4_9ASTR